MDVQSCTNGSPVPGHCPGAANIQCCVHATIQPSNPNPFQGSAVGQSCVANGQSGSCMDVQDCTNGSPVPGHCPGASNIQCCVSGAIDQPLNIDPLQSNVGVPLPASSSNPLFFFQQPQQSIPQPQQQQSSSGIGGFFSNPFGVQEQPQTIPQTQQQQSSSPLGGIGGFLSNIFGG
jgi:hypothetical protein